MGNKFYTYPVHKPFPLKSSFSESRIQRASVPC